MLGDGLFGRIIVFISIIPVVKYVLDGGRE